MSHFQVSLFINFRYIYLALGQFQRLRNLLPVKVLWNGSQTRNSLPPYQIPVPTTPCVFREVDLLLEVLDHCLEVDHIFVDGGSIAGSSGPLQTTDSRIGPSLQGVDHCLVANHRQVLSSDHMRDSVGLMAKMGEMFGEVDSVLPFYI